MMLSRPVANRIAANVALLGVLPRILCNCMLLWPAGDFRLSDGPSLRCVRPAGRVPAVVHGTTGVVLSASIDRRSLNDKKLS